MGERRVADADRRVGVHVALSPNEHVALSELAARLGCSRSEAVRRGLALLAASLD